MHRALLACLVLLVPALFPAPTLAQMPVRIVGRDAVSSHAVGLRVGTRFVPHHSTSTSGGFVNVSTRIEEVGIYAPLCRTPCVTHLPPTPQLEIDGIATDHPVIAHPGSTLVVASDARDAWHAIGWSIDLGGLVVTGLLGLSVLAQDDLSQLDLSREPPPLFDDDWEIARWIAAGGTFLVSQVIGLALIGLRPLADVEVVPGGFRF